MAERYANCSIHPSLLAFAWVCSVVNGFAGERGADTATNGVLILEIAGTAEILRAEDAAWKPAAVQQVLGNGDRFRTRKDSRATLRLSDLSQLRVGELSELQVRRDPDPRAPPIYKLWKGVLYFFHRDKPGRFRLESPIASAAVRGTEFALRVEETDRTVLTLYDGEVELSSNDGRVSLQSGEQGIVEPGKAPTATAMVQAQLRDTVQWVLFYPAVLHLDELGLDPEVEGALGESLSAYRSGDLLSALARYPAGRAAISDAEEVYRAGLLLSVGQVEEVESRIRALPEAGPGVPSAQALGKSLLRLIAAVKGGQPETSGVPASASEWLVQSYVEQARSALPETLVAARKAVATATNFAFGWARVA